MRTAKEYRNAAAEVLDGNWKSAAFASLALFLIIAFAEALGYVGELTNSFKGVISVLCVALVFCVYLPLIYGFYVSMLKLFRGEEKNAVKPVFAALSQNYARATTSFLLPCAYILLMLIPAIIVAVLVFFVLVWTIVNPADFGEWFTANKALSIALIYMLMLVCMIPLIVYGYAIKLVPFLVYDNPKMSVQECIKRSRELMKGRKWKAFCLDFSFIGWAFVCVLTAGIGNLFLLPYQTTAFCIFYDDVVKEESLHTEQLQPAQENA